MPCFEKLPDEPADYSTFDKALKLRCAKHYFESVMLHVPVRGQHGCSIHRLRYDKSTKYLGVYYLGPVKLRGGVIVTNDKIRTRVLDNPSMHPD